MFDIDIKKIAFTGKSEKILLTNVSLSTDKGSVYTIIGKNGEGKTTFLKSLTNLLDKNKFSVDGKVLYNDTDILSLQEKEVAVYRKNIIKYVFQDCLKGFDQLKQLDYYFKLFGNKKDTDELLDYFMLPPYEYLKSLYPYELSYGMAQRLGFIFALISMPEIILLDEPTSAIDPELKNLFLTKIKNFTKQNNKLVLLVTHDLYFAKEISDYIALLADKTITPFFSPNDFFKTHMQNKI